MEAEKCQISEFLPYCVTEIFKMLNPEYKWMAFLEFGAASHPNFALFPNHSMWVFMLDKQIGLNNMYLVVSRMPVDAKGEITDDIR